jgi:hypothetical protein
VHIRNVSALCSEWKYDEILFCRGNRVFPFPSLVPIDDCDVARTLRHNTNTSVVTSNMTQTIAFTSNSNYCFKSFRTCRRFRTPDDCTQLQRNMPRRRHRQNDVVFYSPVHLLVGLSIPGVMCSCPGCLFNDLREKKLDLDLFEDHYHLCPMRPFQVAGCCYDDGENDHRCRCVQS